MAAQPYLQWEHNPKHNGSTTLHTIGATTINRIFALERRAAEATRVFSDILI